VIEHVHPRESLANVDQRRTHGSAVTRQRAEQATLAKKKSRLLRAT